MLTWHQFLERKKKKKLKLTLDVEGEPVIVGEAINEEERAKQVLRWAERIAMNSYKKTYSHGKGMPSEIMGKWLTEVRRLRDYINKHNMPVPLDNLNAATNALTDAIMDFLKTGGIFEPASLPKGKGTADLKSAEHLGQFHQFLNKNIKDMASGKLVYGKQLAQFGNHFDAFIEDLRSYNIQNGYQ